MPKEVKKAAEGELKEGGKGFPTGKKFILWERELEPFLKGLFEGWKEVVEQLRQGGSKGLKERTTIHIYNFVLPIPSLVEQVFGDRSGKVAEDIRSVLHSYLEVVKRVAEGKGIKWEKEDESLLKLFYARDVVDWEEVKEEMEMQNLVLMASERAEGLLAPSLLYALYLVDQQKGQEALKERLTTYYTMSVPGTVRESSEVFSEILTEENVKRVLASSVRTRFQLHYEYAQGGRDVVLFVLPDFIEELFSPNVGSPLAEDVF